QPDGNDRRIGMACDQFEAALQSQQCARAFELAFREKAYDFALGNSFVRSADGCMRTAATDRDAAERPQNRMQNGFVIVLLVNDVANRAGAGELQNKSIHPADVIRHKEKPAWRQIFQTDRSDAIKGTDQ